ncbi:MAG: hypothetical protein OJF52_003303 [Nitrospira sp.]|nr:MAG: hypothetical protein OJF52_003303 [Nitrospira sp.]
MGAVMPALDEIEYGHPALDALAITVWPARHRLLVPPHALFRRLLGTILEAIRGTLWFP